MNGAFRLGVAAAARRRDTGGGGGGGGDGPEVLDVVPTRPGYTASMNIQMPAVVNPGDLLLIVIGCRRAPSGAPAGWSLDFDGSQVFVIGRILSKIADGTEGGTTVTQAFSSGNFPAATVFRIKAGSFKSALPFELATEIKGQSDEVEYPSLAPTWGAANTLWLSAAWVQRTQLEDAITGFPFPAWSLVVDDTGYGVEARYLGFSADVINAASRSPGVASSLSGERYYIAMIIGVQPA